MRGLLSVLALVLVVTLLSFPSSVRAGDPELAGFMVKQGEKAFRAKKFEEAAGYYRKAMREHSPYPEACYGLGRTLEKLGRTREAIQAYRRCCKETAELEQPTSRQGRLLKTVKKAIGKLCEGYARLDKIEAQFVKDCVAFGRKSFTTSKTWARKGFGAALILDPGNKTALAQIARLGPAPAGEAGSTTLAAAKNLSDWELAEASSLWSCTKGAIRIDRPGPSVDAWWKPKLDGRYVLSATLHIERVYGDDWYTGVVFATRFDPMRFYSIHIGKSNRYQLTCYRSGNVNLVTSGQLFSWQRNEPLKVRIEVDHGKVRVLLAGKEIFAREYDEKSEFQGMAGLCVKRAALKVTDMQVVR